MKLFKKLLFGVLCCAVPALLFSQDFSNKGKEFWIAYSYHVGMSGGGNPTMTLYITSDVNTTYSVEIYGGVTLQSGTITAGQVVTAIVPISCFINNEGLFTGRTIRVLTDKNSVVYAYITRSAVSGATVCLPTPVLGKEYYSTNFTQISNELNSNSYFTIIAVEDNTAVEITPASNTKNGWIGGNTYTVNLNKGQIYQVMGTVNGTNGSDLTGSLIKSVASGTGGCKRIAVFSGSGKISIGCGASAGTSDNLYQQLYPTGSWGLKYLTIPSYNRPTNFFRIIRKTVTTNVFLNGTLIPGASFTNNYYQFSNSTPNVITASEPISVAQYFTTQGCSGNAAPYDPDMIMLNPVEQNINNVTLVSSNLAAPTNQQHHLHVIMRNGGTGISSFKLDGNPVSPASWVTHPGDPTYSYLYLPNVSQGYHKLTCDSGFNALAYGYADAESYGYSAGANVKDLYQFVSIINQYATVNFPATCKNTPFYFRIVLPYQPTQIQWVFGSALNALGISDITVNSPASDSSWVVNGRTLYRFSLPSQYNISAIGTYPIKVVANNPTPDGCSGVQEIDYDLQVFNPPAAGFYFNTNGCVTSPVNFFDTSNTGGRPIIQWRWNFGDAGTSSIQNPSHAYAAPGSYFATLSVITDIGCISDIATKNIILTQLPVANFSTNLPSCAGKAITFSDLSTVSAGSTITKWYWDFGDGSPAVIATNNAPQIHTYSSPGSYNATLKVETNTGCQSFVFTKPMMIYSNPVANFNLPNVCLPAGTANFTSTSTVAGGTITNYLWNFGNSQTATTQSATTTYSSSGPFNVSLMVTSNNGCTDTKTSVLNTVFAQPLAAFDAPAEVCLGVPVNFTDQSTAANSTVTQWLWNFGDATTSTSQNPVKNYTTAGTYMVTLTVTSAIGCISTTAIRTVIVNALPTANFNVSAPACVTRNITFTDASSPNSGNLVKWTWNFGDGNNATLNNPSPFIHNYANPGNYNVTLQVETNKGCVSTVTTKPVTINILPDAGFIAPEVCLTDPSAPFIDTSKISTGNIAAWQWNFGDPNANAGNPNTSTVQNPTHRYTVVGNFTATLIATSNNGCTDTISQTFTVNGSIPLANFTVQNANALCSNKIVTITDASTVDFGSVIKTEIYWDWTNDPTIKTTDDVPSPGKLYNHTYPEFGSPATKTVTIRMISYSGITCLNVLTKTITLLATPSLRFDPISEVCSNAGSFQITQASITNGLPGAGVFSGPGVSPSGLFNPNTATAGIHTIRYTFTGANNCSNYIEQTIAVNPTPNANAGPDKVVLEGGVVQLTPAMNAGFPVTYTWTPPTGLNNPNAPDPLASPTDDITYTLKVTSDKGCNTSDQVLVKVLKKPEIPNIFSPNGDGIHDRWVISFLETYPGCTVEVYNRYGQLIYRSIGYTNPWDGTVNGKPVPVGTYYYIVDPKNGRQKQAGYVDIVR
ncbi:MAG TPA: PKD domain-containing protein [Chitinophagaceae bacterium]|nr:PKD domain-containing protein [Chitinophagaceae bacterium]